MKEIVYRDMEKLASPRRSGDHDTYAFGNGVEMKIAHESVKPASLRRSGADDDHRDDDDATDESQGMIKYAQYSTEGGEEIYLFNSMEMEQPASSSAPSSYAVCDYGVMWETISSWCAAAAAGDDRDDDGACDTDSAPESSNEDKDEIQLTTVEGGGEDVYCYAFDPSDDSTWPQLPPDYD